MRPGSAYRLRLKCSEVFEQGFFQDNGYYGNDKRTIIGHVDVTGRYLRPYIKATGQSSAYKLVGRIVGLKLHCLDGRYFDLVGVSSAQFNTDSLG